MLEEKMKVREESLRLERVRSERKDANDNQSHKDGEHYYSQVDRLTLDLIKQGVVELENTLDRNLNLHEEELHEKINAFEKPAGGSKKK
jgi:hypothetical protein